MVFHCMCAQPNLFNETSLVYSQHFWILSNTGGKHKAHGWIRPSTLFYPAWHLVSTRQQCQAPCPWLRSSLHLHSPKITLGPLKATARLMWPHVKMSLTPCRVALFLHTELISWGAILVTWPFDTESPLFVRFTEKRSQSVFHVSDLEAD